MKKIILYAALISLLPVATFAGNQTDGNRKGQVSDYIKQHITPVIMAKRVAFDALLTSTEKNELASIREQLQQLRESHKAARQAEAGEMKDGNAVPHEWHEAWNENRAKMKELIEQVKIIAERHNDQLEKINTGLAPQKAQWKSDIAQIRASKENTEDASASSYYANDFPHFGMEGRFNKMWTRTGFLLLNPSASVTSDDARTADSGSNLAATPAMSIYPNPASDQFTMNLTGIPAENKLIVTDMTGKIVFEKENIVPLETLACNEFNSGIYFVRLSTPDQTINEKLIITH